jgi:hypothetical protein
MDIAEATVFSQTTPQRLALNSIAWHIIGVDYAAVVVELQLRHRAP